MLISIKLCHFNQRGACQYSGQPRGQSLNEMPNELLGAKNETVLLMQCYADLFQGAAAGLIRLNDYRTFLGIYPTYRCKSTQGIVCFMGLAVLEVQGSPKCTWECIVPMTRPSLAFERCSKQPAFQTSDSAIHLSDKHPGPRVRCSLVWETEKEQPQSLFLLQSASCIWVCTCAHHSPGLHPGHSCGCHILLTGVTSMKSIWAPSRQPPIRTTAKCQLPDCTPSLGWAPNREIFPHPPLCGPQLASSPIIRMPCDLNVIPIRQHNLEQQALKWSLPSKPQWPQSHLGPHILEPTLEGVNVGSFSLYLHLHHAQHTTLGSASARPSGSTPHLPSVRFPTNLVPQMQAAQQPVAWRSEGPHWIRWTSPA